MFDMTTGAGAVTPGLSSNVLAGLIAENHAGLVERETRVLLLAAAWADAHDLDPSRGDYQPLVERACAWGGEGTPQVSEYCAVELGALQQTGSMAARMLIADALDLRHRLPRLWAQVGSGSVRAWQARKVAEATRLLSWEAVQEVDDAVSGFVGMMPWGRFQTVLGAAILHADPALAAERAERARTERDVWATDSDDGLKTIIAKATSGDAIWLMATVNRLADILAADGDTDPVGPRRSKALGILADPARALQLLAAHQHDPAPADLPVEPDDTAREPEETEWADDVSSGDGAVDDTRTDDASVDGVRRDGEGDVLADDVPAADGSPEEGRAEETYRSLAVDVPAGHDVEASRPKVVLHFHLSDHAAEVGHGLVRPEHGTMLTLAQLKAFLADTGCDVQVRPVVDPAATAPVDAYEIPDRLRSAMNLRHVAEVFPYGTATSTSLDLDHTIPYDPGGPPGQTGLHNLGPLGRSHHRAVTFGRWQRRQPISGTYLFRSPAGYVYLVTNHGTLPLGRDDFATTIWSAAVA